MFGMFVTVTDFVFAMIIICVDIKRMLDDVLGSTASEENKKIFVQADFKRKVRRRLRSKDLQSKVP